MKTKFKGVLTLLLAFMVQFAFTQEKTISGVVSDDMGPVSDIAVKVRGTDNGDVTDFDGNYTIKAKTGDVIDFTHISYSPIEKIVGASNTIDVLLSSTGNLLDEVVVTALGIKRNSRELGYAVTTIKSNTLNEVRETNILNALQGKSSGLTIKNQSGNVGGSTRILIRGNSSLSGTIEPLFVIDGIPISNSNIATGSRTTGGYDFGNRAQDINPDDIESVSILKGASAAALYGSRAAGGVILITTKKGKQTQKAAFSYNSSFRFEKALVLPNLQNEFASGDFGVYDFGATGGQITSGWGPSISSLNGQTYTNLAGEDVPFQIFRNGIRDFYSTARTSINGFSVSGASEKDDYRLSVTNTEQKGLVPNSRLNRLNLGFNTGKTFNAKLKSRFNINYVRTNTQGTAAEGANDPNVLTSIINNQPITTDFSLFDNYIDDDGNQINDPGGLQNNPNWIAFQNATETSVQRFYGSTDIQYIPFKNFDVVARVGYDTYNDNRALHNSIGTIGRLNGTFTDDNIRNRELTADFIATFNGEINDDLEYTLRGGTQWNERVFERLGNNGTDLTVPNLYDPGNADSNSPYKAYSLRRILGVFGDVTLNYKNWLILNATARNDKSSTLRKEDNNFFYPSVSLSWIFTDALKIEDKLLSYGKLRGAWANVGGDTGFANLAFTFNPDTDGFFGQFGTNGTFPFDGQIAFNSDSVLADPLLGPSNQRTFEIGTELGFFNSRLNLNTTYYNNLTSDDIIVVPTPQSTGYTGLRTNVGGVSNKGIELQINTEIIRHKDFSWNIDYNFTKNTTKVEDLGGIPGGALNLATGFSGIAVRAIEGESFQLFGPRFARAIDSEGNEIEDQILVDNEGLRLVGQPGKIGKIDPDYTMGLTSTFKLKNWRLSTTFDYRKGGLLFSNTIGSLRRSGLAAETAVDRDNLFIDPNTFTQPGGPGTEVIPNTTPISSTQAYWLAYSNTSIIEGNVFDGTFIKWRELSLTYTFPTKFTKKTPFSQLQIGAQARNLAIFNTKINHIDPESGLGGSGSQIDGIERGGVPTTKSFGFNLITKF